MAKKHYYRLKDHEELNEGAEIQSLDRESGGEES